MQISNAPPPQATLALNSAKPMVQAWTVGQLLQATVLAPLQPGRVTLVIGGNRMQAETNSPLRPGDRLTVRVERQAQPTILRVVQTESQASDVQTRALRAALPRQTPITPVLANLAALAKTPEKVPHASAQRWGQLARSLLSSLPESQVLAKPEGLRQALRDSGLFFEARASQAVLGQAPFPSQDLKAGLLRLVSLLAKSSPSPAGTDSARAPQDRPPAPPSPARPQPAASAHADAPATPRGDAPPATAAPHRGAPPRPQPPVPPSLLELGAPEKVVPEIRAQVEGAISRVQLHQLHSLSGEDGGRPIWSAELPVRHEERLDLWSLRIEEEPATADAEDCSRWSVCLAFELQALGPVNARITLQGECVSASFWAGMTTTAELFEANKNLLRDAMQEAGLSVGSILCLAGEPPATTDSAASPPLIQVEA